jgi:hypothetical protein
VADPRGDGSGGRRRVARSGGAGGALLLPAPPAQPTTGLGANGPYAKSRVTRPNPAAGGQYLVVYSPGGSAATPLVGGTCDDARRPVVVVVHGLGAGADVQLLGGESLLYAS